MAPKITKRTWVFGFHYSANYIRLVVRRGTRTGPIWASREVYRPHKLARWFGVTWEAQLRKAVQDLKEQTKGWDDSWAREKHAARKAKRLAIRALKWI